MIKGGTSKALDSPRVEPLLYADSEKSADMRYFGGFLASDPFLAFGNGKERVAVLGALEYGRARKESHFDRVLLLEEWQAKVRRNARYAAIAGRSRQAARAAMVGLLAEAFGIKKFVVPSDFPVGLAFELRRAKVPFKIVASAFFPQRILKTPDEIKALRYANNVSAMGLRKAKALLRAATIEEGKLMYRGRPLTSERMREAVAIACLRGGGVVPAPIVAGGDQACDPHAIGEGPLYANQLIIVDVFPRVTSTGYYGDMTRTFLKGEASEAQRKLVETVYRAQQQAMKLVSAEATADQVHTTVVDYFDKKGYRTKRQGAGYEGFFHSTGHGVGLDIHEAPRLGAGGPRLRSGMVVTAEPGLYYRGLGGVRIEDVVCVTERGAEKLSAFSYQWEIP